MRNIEQVLAEYDKLVKQGKCKFYASDIYNVHDMAVSRSKVRNLEWNLITIGLNYGAAIGYKAGRRARREVEDIF